MVYKKKLNEYEKGFLSCFLDTDGYISLSKVKRKKYKTGKGWHPSYMMGFCNNNIDLLKKIENIIGYEGRYVKKKGSSNWSLRYGKREIIRGILDQIKLIVKEKRRILLLEYFYLADHRLEQSNNDYERKLFTIFDTWESL